MPLIGWTRVARARRRAPRVAPYQLHPKCPRQHTPNKEYSDGDVRRAPDTFDCCVGCGEHRRIAQHGGRKICAVCWLGDAGAQPAARSGLRSTAVSGSPNGERARIPQKPIGPQPQDRRPFARTRFFKRSPSSPLPSHAEFTPAPPPGRKPNSGRTVHRSLNLSGPQMAAPLPGTMGVTEGAGAAHLCYPWPHAAALGTASPKAQYGHEFAAQGAGGHTNSDASSASSIARVGFLPQVTREGTMQAERHCSPRQELVEQLTWWKASSAAERKRVFLAQCRRWHPDKNEGDEVHAKRMFQLLQEKKAWFLSDQ